MDLIIKICGLSSEETLEAALDAKADMIGLVFFPPSPRSVTPARAASLAAQARGRAEITALTVDMDEMGIAEIVDLVKPDWLQFHGAESPAAVAAAKQRFGKKIMKVIGVRDFADLDSANHYTGIADRLLLDAKPPKGSAVPGGHGQPFNWNILEGFEPGMPFMLSGGLHAGNVGEALRITRADGVDVSSGIETAPGTKDPELIRGFIAAARNAAKALSSNILTEKVAS
jgi:phosphoribosylanthranilate isomerase